MDGIGGANKGDKSRGSLGSKAPDGPSPGSAGVEDWVVGSRRCRPRPRRTLEPGQPRAVTSRKSCLVPPWLFCPGDGMGCAGSSSRSGAAWLAGGGGARGSHSLPASLPRAVCSPFHGSPLGKLLQRNYADNYNMRRYLQRQKRARHTNACLQCSLRRALLGGDVLYMYVHAVYCMPRYIEPGNGSPNRHHGAPTSSLVSLLPAPSWVLWNKAHSSRPGGKTRGSICLVLASVTCPVLFCLPASVPSDCSRASGHENPCTSLPQCLPACPPACPPASSCLAD